MKRRHLLAAGIGALAAPAIARADAEFPIVQSASSCRSRPAGRPTPSAAFSPQTDPAARSDRDRRQQERCRGLDRRHGGQERQARRLPLLVATSSTHAINRTAVCQSALRGGQGLHADLLGLNQSPGVLRQPVAAADHDGAGPVTEKIRAVFLRLGRLRQHRSPRRGIPQTLGRRDGRGACALQGRRTGHAGRDGGQCRLGRRDFQHDAAAAPGGQAQDPGFLPFQARHDRHPRSRP